MDGKGLGNTLVAPEAVFGKDHWGRPSIQDYTGGITLRQHCAGLAMQGMLANNLPCDGTTLAEVTKEVAESAVAYADALLAALTEEAK